MIEDVKSRVTARMTGEQYDATIMAEIEQTVLDRLCLRLGVEETAFPSVMYGIAAEASVKVWRRRYYEGISSESVAGLSDNFVEDVLSEYQPEIDAWLDAQETGTATSKKVVRFL